MCNEKAENRNVSEISQMIDTLRFYANPNVYHALSILADGPHGEFFEDVSEDHGDDFYDRAMPGAYARETLKNLGITW